MLCRQLSGRRYRRCFASVCAVATLALVTLLLNSRVQGLWQPNRVTPIEPDDADDENADVGAVAESVSGYCFSPRRRSAGFRRQLKQLLPTAGYAPYGLVLVMRHGDRMPLKTPKRLERLYGRSCQLSEETLKNLLPADLLKQLLFDLPGLKPDFDSARAAHEFYANSNRCEFGQLTPDGFAQAVSIGQTLRVGYWQQLSQQYGLPVSEIRARTSESPRAAHTLTAALYGLVGNKMSEVSIKSSRDYRLCPGECECPLVPLLKGRIDARRSALWKSERHRRLLKTFRKFFYDFRVSSYLELLLPLHCWSNSSAAPVCVGGVGDGRADAGLLDEGELDGCVSVRLLQQLWDAHTDVDRQLQRQIDFRRLSIALSYPLLTDIVDRLRRPQRRRLTLLAGHDHTVKYLLHSLRAWDGVWPRYASTVAFELTRHATFFLKHNGRDLTPSLPFCQESPCQVKRLAEFASSGIFRGLGAVSYDELCAQQL